MNSVGSSGGLAMPKYFVWRFSSYNPYRAYGIRNHVEPDSNDPRCIWRGDSLKEARDMAKKANKRPTFHSWLEEGVKVSKPKKPIDPLTLVSEKDSRELYDLVLDLRNALAAAIRVLAQSVIGVDAFLAEARRVGINDGIGVRADEWLKDNLVKSKGERG